MSAFVVADETINRVVTWLSHEAESREDCGTLKRLASTYEIDLVGSEWEDSLAHRMFDLNCVAVNNSYGEGQAEEFRDLDFQYRYQPCPSRVQVLKSLQCWLYQCCEGEYDQMPLYRFFTEVSHSLALKIVMDLPAYERAEWG